MLLVVITVMIFGTYFKTRNFKMSRNQYFTATKSKETRNKILAQENNKILASENFIISTFSLIICDWILENGSKSHMKSSVFLHVFNDISTYVYVFTEYFLHSFSNLSIEFLVVL